MSDLTLYYAPHSRAAGARTLLEELRAPYELKVLSLKAGDQRKPEYLAINPMGKVPTIVHKGAVVTEQTAIYQYLADAFPKASLAPAIGDALRGPYLRWFAFYAGCFEPALADKAQQRDSGNPMMSGYGSYDAVLKTIGEQLSKGPYMLGEKFTALDVLWGGGLGWTTEFGIVPKTAVIMDYVKRATERPAYKKVKAADNELAAQQEQAA